jgi:hypothetical protein
MMTRYDLEQKIHETHNFVDHLNDISYGVLETQITNDEIADAIHGVAILLKLHTEKMFDLYKRAFNLDEYRDDFK